MSDSKLNYTPKQVSERDHPKPPSVGGHSSKSKNRIS